MIVAYFYGFYDLFSFDSLKTNREQILQFTQTHPFLSPIIFIAFYSLITALSIPGAIFVTIIGGYIFPLPYSTLYVLVGATIGASIVFLAAKTALSAFLLRKAQPKAIEKIQKGFEKHASYYLLFLRLVPIFPFWLINILPAFLKVRFSTFLWTTVIGIIPGAYILSSAGRELGKIISTQQEFSIQSFFSLKMKILLALVGILMLLPVVMNHFRKKA